MSITLHAQGVEQQLAAAWRSFENDEQLKAGIASLHVIDAHTGKVIFSKNAHLGMAPASTQKVITAAAAYELLGREFRYVTEFSYEQVRRTGNEIANVIHIKPSGDPTLGSWRYAHTKENAVWNRLLTAARRAGLQQVDDIKIEQGGWNTETIPGGWTWQDIGNYYGAGATGINWRENQYDILLKGGRKQGDTVSRLEVRPSLYDVQITSLMTSAGPGTGDRSYIFFSPDKRKDPSFKSFPLTVRGTIPVNETIVVSGAMPSSEWQFLSTFSDSLGRLRTDAVSSSHTPGSQKEPAGPGKIAFHEEISPAMDSMIYWFLRKSVNLYGEAFIKTIAWNERSIASTDTGIAIVKRFWKAKGIDPAEMKIIDGSGLSPENRVSAFAQVEVLKYARRQPWFNGFYEGFPLYNKMKMKSGTISGVKGFTGYHKSRQGKEYIFSFIVNNYNGSSTAITDRMFRVLDILK